MLEKLRLHLKHTGVALVSIPAWIQTPSAQNTLVWQHVILSTKPNHQLLKVSHNFFSSLIQATVLKFLCISRMAPLNLTCIKGCLFMCRIENVTKWQFWFFYMSFFLINLLIIQFHSFNLICRPGQSQPDARYSTVLWRDFSSYPLGWQSVDNPP